MPGDLERLPAPVFPAAPGGTGGRVAGPGAVLAAELLGRVRTMRSARARRAYAGDVTAWLGWLADRGHLAGPEPLGEQRGPWCRTSLT
jgi:hypothetical protein